MEYKLVINGVDFTPYVRENGIQQGETRRQQRRVVTLDGNLHMTEVVKRTQTVRLVELRTQTLRSLFDALSSPAAVEYTDKALGDIARRFVVTGRNAGVRKVQGGNTYWSGASFTLEEI